MAATAAVSDYDLAWRQRRRNSGARGGGKTAPAPAKYLAAAAAASQRLAHRRRGEKACANGVLISRASRLAKDQMAMLLKSANSE